MTAREPEPLPVSAARDRWTELVRGAEDGRTAWIRDPATGDEAALSPLPAPRGSAGWPRWTVTDARHKLGDLVRDAAAGQPAVLTRRARPVAALVPAPHAAPPAPAPEPAPAADDAPPLGDLLSEWDGLTASGTAPDPVPTGLPGLDDATAGGLRPGRLAVLTAPPAAGASACVLGMARAAALADPPRPVLVVTGQLARRDVLLRLLAAEAPASLQHLADGTLPAADRPRVAGATERLRTAPLHVADRLTTLRQVRDAAAALGDGPALVLLDPVTHVGFGSAPPPLALRRLAQDLGAAVVATLPAGHGLTAPLETEADLVLRLERDGDRARLALTRHRHGPTTALDLRADLGRARLLPAGPGDPPPPAAPAPGPVPVPEPDRAPSGDLLWADPQPCVLCGQPTPLRARGLPQHMGGLCAASAAAPAPAPAPAGDRAPQRPTPPARAASRPARRDTSGMIARNVERALADNDGDVQAATAALVKRAIPDGMALLNSTRVGSTYDFTFFLSLDDIPVLKKPSRDGADLVWEGRPKWRNPTLHRRGPRQTVTALDINGAYLSALKCHLPIGKLVHSPTGEYDRKRSGIYLVTPPAWEHPHLPNPLGNREEPGPLWITDPTLRLLLRLSGPRMRLCDPPVIHESWTSGSSEALLERFRRELAAARDAALDAGDTVTLEYVKAIYSKFVSTIGESSANREMRRPDWMHLIRSQAFANLWLKAYKAHEAGLTIVRMMGTDELHVTGGDWRRVFREGRRLTEVKVKEEYTIGGEG
ncbi:type II toxin-antitoxin system prevent-host-death family antitoxin [Streptomyces sp. 7-21]|uniref:type II toxin-antitoxin system prevent-host-death family antitoxin n=1 Tax=Streptomyces sp. 7-21 TaxID=2802283 RepID=UPI00191E85E6|nr:type II toxin-antitoxin system prevent-host-death family antitoxin [Streptomyces sp. 7-21]MBL1067177.1 type II toxin-antitoxin system prevent-host-death family antitoxin [Streptomyces sp. 7-21]